MGQEVHARLHHRGHVNRKLFALEIPEAAAAGLEPDSDLYLDGSRAGVITSRARLPAEGVVRAVAMLRYKQVAEQPPLAARPGGPAEIRVRPLATDLGAPRS